MATIRSILLVLMVVLVLAQGQRPARNRSRYAFYRSMAAYGGGGDGDSGLSMRRVFGGEAAQLTYFPTACALLDRYWMSRCSATVVAPRWALTAAHCVSPRIAYVKYNTRRPASPEGDVSPVYYLYKHPEYKVLQEDEGRGMDVTLLHHDVGLVRTRDDMNPYYTMRVNPIKSMRTYNPVELKDKEVQAIGFGRTEKSSIGEELFAVNLRLVFCEHSDWFHCMCGMSQARSGRGVCSGDSGGPLVYKGVQVGITSMGPTECATPTAVPAPDATSVFTALYNYAEILNDTIHDTDVALRVNKLSGAKRYQYTYIILLLTVTPVLCHPR